jgi:signal transduction histidine kinase
MKIQLGGAVAVLLATPFVPDVSRDHRLELMGLLLALSIVVVVMFFTVGRNDPRAAWCVTTIAETVTIFLGVLVLPDAFVACLLAYAVVVAATTAIGGLGIGLLVSLAAAAAAFIATIFAPGDPASIALAVGLAAVGYPTIALSVDGFSLSRHRAATQLARLQDTLRAVSAEPSLSATLDSLVEAVRGAFGSDSAVVLLRTGDDLELAAPVELPLPQWTSDRVARLTENAMRSTDATPVAWAMSSRETVVVRDVATDPRFTSAGSVWRDRLVGIGLESMVVVPLRRGTTAIGLFHVGFERPGALEDDELALLEAYAEQATILILRAQAYAELEAADALKSEFLATVSHELRTPLTAAKGFVDTVLLHWDRLDDRHRRELLERASGNADELARLIDQLLDYSRLDAGTVRVLPVPTALADAVDALVARMAPVLEGHLLLIDVEVDLLVLVDQDAFAHVLGNLLTNAARFSPAGSMIRVKARPADGFAVVSVHDDGIGIAAEEQHRVFERFYRVGDGTGSGGGRGTGIGLAIVERFVELLGGRVWLESAPGEGSVFSFSIPLTPTPEVPVDGYSTAPAATHE